MRKQDVLDEYGGAAAVAKALGITIQAVYRWKEIIPERRAARLGKLNKRLIYKPEIYENEIKQKPRQ